jgi:formyltetrahydrofolate synthetase
MVTGAGGRILLLEEVYGLPAGRATVDLDFGVMVESWDQYRHLEEKICADPQFSTDPKQRGAPSGHVVHVREVRLAAGAEFVVMLCGDVMTMPGLPKQPAAEVIDLDDEGQVVGLF